VCLIYTCPYSAVLNMNVLRFCDMNSINVGAMPWCNYHEIGSFDVYAFLKREMHLWCIFYPQVIYGQIVIVEESHGLYIHNKKGGKSLLNK
jgi:hypothetical protein